MTYPTFYHTVYGCNIQTTESQRPSLASASSGYSFFGFSTAVKESVDPGLRIR